MARAKNIGKTLAMLILLIILILGGMMWFDYLGVINAKTLFAPVYGLLGLQTQTTISNTQRDLTLVANLEDDRLAKRLEEQEIRNQELDQREQDVTLAEAENLQIGQELEERQIAQEEREITFINEQKKYDDRSVNIEQNAKNLNAMRPADAVEILNEMEDQDLIDTLRKIDELAFLAGTASQVSNWLSLMPPDRVAEIQRKMVSKPTSLN